MNVCFDTFGCRLNRAEALDEEARWAAHGHRVVASHAEADLVVVRCCSVTSRAQGDCERLIAHLRRKYPNTRLRVCGCLPGAERGVPAIPDARADRSVPAAADPLPTRTARAYLKVQDGCAGKCAFCTVPRFRGRPASVPLADALARARRFADAGYREVVVTGCNLALYADGARRLPDLVAALADAVPECRLRLGSVEPGRVASDLIDAMAAHANACRFLHLAAQSGSDDILRTMRRPYAAADVAANVEKALRLMPGLGLGCDLMAGFPGETELDFEKTRQLLRSPFSKVHVFQFSARPGTAAAVLPRQVPHDVRARRAHRLSEAAKANLARFARSFVGRTVEIVCEHRDHVAGWTSEYLWLEREASRGAGGQASAAAPRRERLRLTVKCATPDGVLRGVPAEGDGR